MAVPIATMNKDDALLLRKDKIRFSWKILTMKSESVSKPMNKRTHDQLGLCIAILYSRHVIASYLTRVDISHIVWKNDNEKLIPLSKLIITIVLNIKYRQAILE